MFVDTLFKLQGGASAPNMEIWVTATFTLSLVGIIMAACACVGIAKQARPLIFVYLCYVFLFLSFRIVYNVFGFDSSYYHSDAFFTQFIITTAIVAMFWTQLYYIMYLFRIFRFYDVYIAHSEGRRQAVPKEDLVALTAKLGQYLKMSQIIELLSLLPEHVDTFTFDQFCQIEACFFRNMQKKARHLETATMREPLVPSDDLESPFVSPGSDRFSFPHRRDTQPAPVPETLGQGLVPPLPHPSHDAKTRGELDEAAGEEKKQG